MNIVNIVRQTRYLVIIPIIGLALSAAVLFVAGGVGLVTFLVQNIGTYSSGSSADVLPIFGLLEHEDLEINIVGVIVVVLAIEFLGAVFTGRQGSDLGSFGIGIAVTIAALALFIAVRHWTETSDASLAKEESLAKKEESQISPTLPMLDGRGDGVNRAAQDN